MEGNLTLYKLGMKAAEYFYCNSRKAGIIDVIDLLLL